MKRIVCAPGIGQVVNASAALAEDRARRGEDAAREDVLVLYGAGRHTELARAMERIAGLVWEWKALVWAEDILVAHFPTRRFAPLAADLLRERLGKTADEIWISKPAFGASKLMLNAFPGARVMLFEDGAEDFLDRPVVCGSERWRGLGPAGWPGGLRREISHWRGVPECLDLDGVCARHLERVGGFFSFLAALVEPPSHLAGVPRILVAKETLLGRLRALRPLLDGSAPGPEPWKARAARVLFLPQPFATLSLTEEDEYALFRAAVATVLDKGYTVLWKEHPREITPVVPRLQEEFGPDRLFLLRTPSFFPVEAVAGDWGPAAVVSVSSTSLLSLRGLHGWPGYTAAGLLAEDRWKLKKDLELARLFRRAAPGLDALPAAVSKPM